MLQYVFKPADIGRTEWPSGELRLQGIETTDDPVLADLFVCPGPLALFENDSSALERFPYIKGRENRLVCFDVSEFNTIFTLRDPVLIRCNLKQFMLDAHPNSISFPWPVEDMSEVVDLPGGKFLRDVSFQGWLSSETRARSIESCRQTPDLTCDIATYSDFTGYLHDRTTGQWTSEGIRRRAEFRRSMRESRVALCPESIPGDFPYRFFEAMSAGRVPLLVGTGQVFPWADQIPYDQFCLKLPAEHASNAGSLIREFIRQTSDEDIIAMGKMARHYWERYLDCRQNPKLMAEAVLLKLTQLQCAS